MRFNWIEESKGIYYSQDKVFTLSGEMIEFLLLSAKNNEEGRQSRLCTHFGHDNLLHEMIIVHLKGNYIPPHKHINKVESFHIIQGKLAVVLFSSNGEIKEIVLLDANKGNLYYRLSESLFHTVVPLSEYIVFHEVTNGPFKKDEMVLPEWAPQKGDPSTTRFQDELNNAIFDLAQN
jgi:cupin fold WbuC family metalloprotein